MNVQQIADATGATMPLAVEWGGPLVSAMHVYNIDTPARQAAFLSQIGHESGGLRYTSEIWGPTAAQSRYDGRRDLGNTQPGDGYLYRGRGLIQITGRANYAAAGNGLATDLIANPDALAQSPLAATSAAWWWKSHGLNSLADGGKYEAITRIINGGLNGYDDRLARWAIAKVALGAVS